MVPFVTGWLGATLLSAAIVSYAEAAQRAVLMRLFSAHVSAPIAEELWRRRAHHDRGKAADEDRGRHAGLHGARQRDDPGLAGRCVPVACDRPGLRQREGAAGGLPCARRLRKGQGFALVTGGGAKLPLFRRERPALGGHPAPGGWRRIVSP
ncbi:protein of unknown function [Rhodovastum atsumiense]|nr:protein of unknown function [Rhodovastum atsumiense]